MRLVLDTNVLLAAFVSRGVCHDLLEHCERAHRIVASEFILEEFADKLLRKFKVPSDKVQRAVALLRPRMEVIEPPPLDLPTCRDPDDDWVLATALAGQCACIVTGDKDLLTLEVFSGIRILPPSAFWAYESE
ncbi:MAG TPA: putative toxin-antitoxin system toxin component, PIN family [Longimicrobiaceae bacterium]|nr:putative toxin-antitoxin system toxin component, PIN family [Longimicrobiaceae bacterium]